MKPSVAFVVTGGGLLGASMEGIVSFDGVDVKIEFRHAPGTLGGLLKPKVEEVNIALDGINAIELRESRGWFRRSPSSYFLFVRVAQMGAASSVPTFDKGEILLPITDARAAAELASAVRVAARLKGGAS